MGRRRVRTAPHSDGTVEQPAGITSSTASSAAGNSNGLQAPGSSAAAAAADKGDAPREGKNPLMGLLHYGSDSDEEGASAESAPAQDSATPSAAAAAAADANPPPSSDPAAVAGEVTYALPDGWQQCMDNAGLVYFWNTETGITAWDPPEGTEITRLAPSPAAAATAAAAAAPVGASPEPSMVPSPAATGATGGNEQVGSDATSDTASEAEYDRAETAGAAAVEEEEEEEAGGDEGTSGNEKSAQFPPGSRAGADLDGDGGAKAEGGLSDNKGEVPQQKSTVSDGAAGEGSALGIDDLLADIEAELLSGGGEDAGGKDNVRSDGGGGGDRTGSNLGGEKEEDFSSLRLLAPGLDARAQKAHAEVVAFLATPAAGKGVGSGSISAGTGMRKLGIELSAVLRCRLSDWREGGLDGAFLVSKLEDMASQTRAALDPSSTSSSQTPGVAAPGPADATTSAASVVRNSTAASGSSSSSSSSLSPPVPSAEFNAAESQSAAAAAAAATAAVADDKPKGRSKKRRRSAGGGGDATASSAVTEEATGTGRTDPERQVVGDVIIRKAEGAKVTPAAAVGGGVDADAGANGGGGGGAELSRAERNAQQLKWADEVSAAASAAVAAAAALSQAKKEQAKAQAKAKAKQKQKEKQREKERQKQKERGGGVDLEGVGGSQDSKGVRGGEGAAGASPESGAGVEGAIDLGVVGNGEEQEDGEEDGEVTSVGSAAARSESKTAGAVSSQAVDVDAAETGIVIAKEASPAELPSGWAAVFDTKNQAFYYHNLATDETTWVLPVAPTARVPGTDETVPEASPKSSTQLDNPTVKADKRSKADGRSSNGRGGDGGGSDPTAKSAKRSQRRKSPGEDETGGLVDRSDAATGSKASKNATEKQTRVDKGPDKEDAPEDAQPTAVAAGEKEGDSAGATGSLPSPWVAVWDDTQKAFYYHNTATDETSWEVPAAPDPDVPAAATAAATAAGSTPAASLSSSSTSSSKKQNQHKKKKKASSADAAVVLDSAAARHSSPSPDAAGAEADPPGPAVVSGGASAAEARRRSPSPMTPAAAASVLPTEPSKAEPAESAPAATAAAAVVDLRPSTLVWWSDAGDVWNGVALSGLLGGYGPRRYRNLGGGYYMTTLELGPEWATAAAAALGQGAADPVAAARVDWVSCTASAPGYGLFLRFSGDDDELKLFDVPDEYFDDPPPDPAAVAALAEAEAAAENAEMEAAAAAAVAATEEAEAAGSEAAATLATAATEASTEKARTDAAAAATATANASATKKRKSKGSGGKSGGGVGSIGKKRKGAADLLAKWRAVASTAGEEAEKEAEKQAKMERWKAQAAAQDPNNSNFTPIGKKRR